MKDECKYFAKQLRNLALKKLGCQKFTLYISDPWWPGELRLYDHAGLDYPEPMLGFLEEESVRRRVTVGGDFEIWEDAKNARELRDQAPDGALDRIAWNLGKENRLYDDFVGRESVSSAVRLIVRDSKHQITSVLFLNYTERKTGDHFDRLQEVVNDTREFLIEQHPLVVKYIKENESPPVGGMHIALNAASALAAMVGSPAQALQREMILTIKQILKHSLEYCGFHGGIGTFHAINPETKSIDFIAGQGDVSAIEEMQGGGSVPLSEGRGIVTWVALRGKSVAIEDMQKSGFRSAFLPLRTKPTHCEIAVPVRVGTDLIGVLNLEHHTRSLPAARSTVIRCLNQVAKLAGMAYRFCQESVVASKNAIMLEKLLQICSQVPRDPNRSIDELAQLYTYVMKADLCDIFSFQPSNVEIPFVLAGSTSSPDERRGATARKGGLTQFVLAQKSPSWIRRIDGGGNLDYTVDCVDDIAGTWRPHLWDTNSDPMPALNPNFLQTGVLAELGVPLATDSEPLGVVWIKYRVAPTGKPTSRDLEMVESLIAGQGGLILAAIRNTWLRNETERVRGLHSGLDRAIQLLRHEGVAKVLHSVIAAKKEHLKSATTEIVISTDAILAEIHALEYLQDYIENMSRFSAISGISGERPALAGAPSQIDVHPRPVAVKEVLRQSIRIADLFFRRPACVLSCSETIAAFVDDSLFRFTLVNLLQNAKKYTPDEKVDQPVIITVSEVNSGEKPWVQVQVDNAGYDCLTPEQLVLLGTQNGIHFDQGGKRNSGSGTGIFTSSRIAETMGGVLLLPTEVNERGGFTVKLRCPSSTKE